MEDRIHELEGAISALRTAENLDPSTNLLSSISAPLANGTTLNDDSSGLELKPVAEETRSQPQGTLHVNEEAGCSLFYGPGGGSESLLLRAESTENRPVIQDLDTSYLPAFLTMGFSKFLLRPRTDIPRLELQQTIESFLPPIDRAKYLVENCLEQLSWMFQFFSRKHLIFELIPLVYRQESDGEYGPHDLALLMITMAIGALVDEQLPPYNLEAQHYYQLVQAAVSIQKLLVEESLTTVKVLHLMSIYNGMSGRESNIELCYNLLNLAAQSAIRVGLHMDPSTWGFTGKEAYDRRHYFYNLFSATLWQALVTGRPLSILPEYINCRIPTAEEEEHFQQGEVPIGFGRWGFLVDKEVVVLVTKAVLAVKSPSYAQILELDEKIDELKDLDIHDADPNSDQTSITMRAFVRAHYTCLMKMFLHRGHFAEVLTETPSDPLNSPRRHSFVSAYEAACAVLDETIGQMARKPILCSRVWMIWSFAFSAAMIVGSVAVRCPEQIGLQPPPVQKFEETCQLFSRAAETSARAARGLPILLAMRERIVRRWQHQQYRNGAHPESSTSDEPQEELSLFGGLTPLVTSKRSTPRSSKSPPTSVPTPVGSVSPPSSLPPAHPRSQPAYSSNAQTQITSTPLFVGQSLTDQSSGWTDPVLWEKRPQHEFTEFSHAREQPTSSLPSDEWLSVVHYDYGLVSYPPR